MTGSSIDRVLSSERASNIRFVKKAAAAAFSRQNIYHWKEKRVELKTPSEMHTQDALASEAPCSLIPTTIRFRKILMQVI